MIYQVFSILTLLPHLALSKTAAQLCRGTQTLSDDGNWYCSEVMAITYKNISQPGEYNRTTRVNPKTGLCEHEPVAYSGVSQLTPLIGELSMHLRGPMNVSKLAVYKLPDFSISKRSNTKFENNERKAEPPSEEADATEVEVLGSTTTLEKRWICEHTPTVTITVHTSGSTCGVAPPPPPAPSAPALVPAPVAPPPPPPAPAPAIPSPPPAATHTQPALTTTVRDTTTICPKSSTSAGIAPTGELLANSTLHDPSCPCQTTLETRISSADAPPPSSSPCSSYPSEGMMTTQVLPLKRGEQTPVESSTYTPATTPIPQPLRPSDDVKKATPCTWERVAYYTSAAPAAATGFAFLANLGDPQKSGTFDYAFGNSLGYVIGDGSKVASQRTPFSGTLETSEREIAVFTDKVCDGNCEYARPDATAHYGWDGPSKAFFIEFQMDHYDNYGNDQGMLSDAPAWWFLNAAIPRILQYGNDRNNIPCSCWSTGCGEFDAFEVLGRGEMRAKSTIHRQGNLEGGDSNYFVRPVGRMLKFVVVFHDWNITARVLNDNFDFSEGVTAQQIEDILKYDPKDNFHSLFAIGD
ncbi:hypothetical protein K458DRAFT_444167 [Lentithecium fluviatile CBS 122367]|uniref:glucan endo-1,3-beta-D-glucosidase n=1 Tax=Lentithecium fluviatile CBS 122367 TaxID=1168545 RepID=A0A6G1IW99_9PLEO|nr:hypothetical protein K458DRAFT_444167 [Lentithecium fluviatile CBS 122367]